MVTRSTPYLIAIGSIFLLPAAAPSAPPVLREKDPPVVWKTAELNAALPNSADGGPATVLVWEVIEFDGVFTDEERCLVLKRYDKVTSTGQRYALGILWRQPKIDKPAWRPAVRYVEVVDLVGDVRLTVVVATEEYKEIPTGGEFQAFLKKNAWQDKLAPRELALRIRGAPTAAVRYGPKLVDGGVPKGAWKKELDREPAADLFPELAPRATDEKRRQVGPPPP